MEITYDPSARAVYMRIAKKKHKGFNTKELQQDSIYVDYNRDGNIIGIEVLYVNKVGVKIYANEENAIKETKNIT